MTNKFFNFVRNIIPHKLHWVLDHEGFKRYFANTGWMLIGQMFSLLVAFFIGAWLARYLGPENYGILSYSIAFVGLFGFITSLGIDGILNRELIKNPEKRDELLGTAFLLKFIGGLLAFSLTIIFIIVFQSNHLIKILVTLFAFSFLLQAIGVISIYFQSEVKAKNNVKAIFIATIISSVLKVVVILLNKGLMWFVVVFVFDFLWQGIGYIKAYHNYGLKIKNWYFNKKLAKNLLKNSWPLMLASAAGIIYLKIDQVMIGSLLGIREVGIYAVAVKLVEVWYFIPGIICASIFPAIINAKKSSIEIYKNRMKSFYILMTVIPVVMAIFITFLAKPIIQILFGGGYLESVNILRIYIWSSIGFFLNMALTQYLMSENLVKIIFWINFLAMFINIILNFIFIPTFGIIGSAWATLISYLIGPILILIFYKKI